MVAALAGGFTKVLKSGCKRVINLLNFNETCLSEIGSIFTYINTTSKELDIIFNFVSRDCNRVVRGLARYAFVSSTSYSHINY